MHNQHICQQIKQLNTALFYDESDNLIKFPISIIRVVTVDDDGNLLFLLHKPYTDIRAYSSCFPAKLEFHNKRYPFCITVWGQAELTGVPNELVWEQTACNIIVDTNHVLIWMHINDALYYNSEEEQTPLRYFEKLLGYKQRACAIENA